MFPIRTKKGKPAGELRGFFDFYVPVELEIVVKEGRNMYNPNLLGKSDPYLQFITYSQCDLGTKTERSTTCRYGGKTPNWKGQSIKMKLVDHAELKIVCWDD
ncbi:hypothetical protein TrCOL_g7815, partial [Triparma columacea]